MKKRIKEVNSAKYPFFTHKHYPNFASWGGLSLLLSLSLGTRQPFTNNNHRPSKYNSPGTIIIKHTTRDGRSQWPLQHLSFLPLLELRSQRSSVALQEHNH